MEGMKYLKLAIKYGIDAKSEITKQLLENCHMKQIDLFGKYRLGSIKSVLKDVGDNRLAKYLMHQIHKQEK